MKDVGVDSRKSTDYTYKDENGVIHQQKITMDKDTGEIKQHTIDGKKIVKYTEGNGQYFLIMKQQEVIDELKILNKQIEKLFSKY